MELMVFGHRGVPSLATENSLSSFKEILNNSIEGVELDVHLTRDNKLVVIHDFNTFKMSGLNYEVSETDYSVIENLKIGNNERIPLLHEVFDLLGKRVFYDIEVKSRGKNRNKLVKILLDLIKKYNLESHCMVSSFDPLLLKAFNKLKSGIPVSIIYSNDKDQPFLLRFGFGAFLTNIDVLKPHFKQLKGFVYFIYVKILRKKCFTWTVNTMDDLNIVNKSECHGICSNFPQNFIV